MAVTTGYITLTDVTDGVSGNDGLNTAQVAVYQRAATEPTTAPDDIGEYTFGSGQLRFQGPPRTSQGTPEAYTFTLTSTRNANTNLFVSYSLRISDDNDVMQTVDRPSLFALGASSNAADFGRLLASHWNSVLSNLGWRVTSTTASGVTNRTSIRFEATTVGNRTPNMEFTAFNSFHGSLGVLIWEGANTVTTTGAPTPTATYAVVEEGGDPAMLPGLFDQTDSNGWSVNVPSGNVQLWERRALAIGRGTVAPITVASWSSVIQAGSTGVNGDDGLNQATVMYYRRTPTNTAPSAPLATSTYNFNTGQLTPANNTGWQDVLPPDSDGRFLWIVITPAISRGNSIAIPANMWTTPQLLSRDGVDGIAGLAGENAFSVDVNVNRAVIQNSDGTFPTEPVMVSAIFTNGEDRSFTVNNIDTVNITAQTGTLTPVNGNRSNVIIGANSLGTSQYQYDVAFTDNNQTVTVTLETINGVILARDTETINIINKGEDGTVNNFIFIDLAPGQIPTTPSPSPGVPTIPYVGTNAISYTWSDSPAAVPNGILWTSQGSQRRGEGNFDWTTPVRFTGVEGRSSRLDIAYFTNVPEQQQIAISGTRSNVVTGGVNRLAAQLSLPESFNSGLSFNRVHNTSTTSGASAISLENGVFLDVDSQFTYTEDVTDNPGQPNDATFFINNGPNGAQSIGGTSRSANNATWAGYLGGRNLDHINENFRMEGRHVFNENRPAGGYLIVGPGGQNQPDYVHTPNDTTFRRTAAESVPDTNEVRNGYRYMRWNNAGFDPISGSNYDIEIFVGTVGSTDVGIIAIPPTGNVRPAFQVNVSMFIEDGRVITGRRGRLRNTNQNSSVNYAGSIGTNNTGLSGLIPAATGTDISTHGTTSYFNAIENGRLSYNVTLSAQPATWSFDPDVDNAVHAVGISVPTRALTANLTASQALSQIQGVINGLAGISSTGVITTRNNVVTLTVDLGTTTPIRPSFNMQSRNGLNVTPGLNVQGQSSYQVFDYNGTEVICFTSSVAEAFTSDRSFVVAQITQAIDDNVESPIDFIAQQVGSTIRISARDTGAVTGLWRIVVNHGGASGTDIGNLAFGTATETTIGRASGSYAATSYPSGRVTDDDYMGANPRGHNHLGERLVIWGEGTPNATEPEVSTTPSDYAIIRLNVS